jgi:hypothetical protein
LFIPAAIQDAFFCAPSITIRAIAYDEIGRFIFPSAFSARTPAARKSEAICGTAPGCRQRPRFRATDGSSGLLVLEARGTRTIDSKKRIRRVVKGALCAVPNLSAQLAVLILPVGTARERLCSPYGILRLIYGRAFDRSEAADLREALSARMR